MSGKDDIFMFNIVDITTKKFFSHWNDDKR